MLKQKVAHFKSVIRLFLKQKELVARVIWLFFETIVISFYLFTNRKKLIIIGLYEHIGDIISCEPVLQFLTDSDKDARIIWILKEDYKELIEYHPYVFKAFGIKYFSEWVLYKKLLLKIFKVQSVVDLHLSPKTCSEFGFTLFKNNYGIHRSNYLNDRSQLQAFSTAAGLPSLTSQPRFFCSHDHSVISNKVPYVVFHTASNMKTKDWMPEKWEQLFYQVQKFGFKIVEIGLTKSVSVQSSDYIDYTGKKSLLEIASIIKNARYFIGIDSGFAHMANSLEKEGLVLIGEYHIEQFIHRHYNPFSGKYRNQKHIVYSDTDGLARAIPVDKVVASFKTLIEGYSRNVQAN